MRSPSDAERSEDSMDVCAIGTVFRALWSLIERYIAPHAKATLYAESVHHGGGHSSIGGPVTRDELLPTYPTPRAQNS